MNIFFLSTLPGKAANLQCDKHVVRMILESTQIIYTVLSMLDVVIPDVSFDDVLLKAYKPTHKHHPSVLWVLGGRDHFAWLLRMAIALCRRYTRIYNKVHKCEHHLHHVNDNVCEEQLPENATVSEWVDRLEYHNVPLHVIEASLAKVATVNAPIGCHFGVVCIESKTPGIPTSHLIARDEEDSEINLTASYKRYYHYKATNMFSMMWAKSATPPKELSLRTYQKACA